MFAMNLTVRVRLVSNSSVMLTPKGPYLLKHTDLQVNYHLMVAINKRRPELVNLQTKCWKPILVTSREVLTCRTSYDLAND